jgi:two-component system, sensor histidine kinase and response regulator
LHLLSNAVKFTERGELEVQVVGACAVHNQVSLTFSIIDSGLGIARDDQRRIFSAFEQVDNSTTRLYGGAGLGLTMAAELLRRMGGQLSVESRLGQGSRFSFQLSLRTDADREDVPDAAEPAAESAPRRPLSILLAEDTPGNQQVICSILSKRGHSTLVASNGAEAVQSFRSRQQGIDVILMDVQMPVMDGYDATAEIRRLESGAGRRVPIIALTAHAPQGSQQECFAAGMDAYISKPIDLRKLTEAVEQLGYGRSRLREDFAGGSEPGNGAKGTLVDIPGVMRRLGGDLALLKEFVQVFDEDAPQLLESLRTALACGDASTMERGAHSLKGLTSNFGASRVVELAGKVEDAARAQRLDGSTQVLVQQLEREVSRLMAALADYR